MNYYNDLNVRAHREKLETEAAAQRLANLARSEAADDSSPVYGPALARLGAALVEMGTQLQTRYGDMLEQLAEPPATPATDPASSDPLCC
jgi:hypothetical protein